MSNLLEPIPVLNLAYAFLPVGIVIVILYRWCMRARTSVYAIARMLVQLLLIGHVLTFVFETDRALVVLLVLTVMLVAASWISLRPLTARNRAIYLKAAVSIGAGGLLTLILVTQGVLELEPWYKPRFVLPLAGMIFASSMNTLSLAGERFEVEWARRDDYVNARRDAYRAALIPLTNNLFAVGIVSIPGMMTGQILSGVEPLVAVRYQIMVMCMIFGAAGISSAMFLALIRPREAVAAVG